MSWKITEMRKQRSNGCWAESSTISLNCSAVTRKYLVALNSNTLRDWIEGVSPGNPVAGTRPLLAYCLLTRFERKTKTCADQWLTSPCPSARISREQANGRQYRTRGHFFAGFADANVRCRTRGRGSISRPMVLFRYFSAHSATVAHLRAAGRVRICCCCAGNLSPHRAAWNGDPLR